MGLDEAGYDESQGFVPSEDESPGEFTLPMSPIKDRPQPNLRQQDKIIKILDTRDFNLFRQHNVDVSAGERGKMMRNIAGGSFRGRDFQELLLNIRSPIQDEIDPKKPEDLFSRIAPHKQQRGILARFARGDFNQRDALDSADLVAFLKKYPEPMVFDAAVEGFLDEIEAANGSAKRAEYERSLRSFEHTIYGKRQEYWEQMQLLIEEAHRLHPQGKGLVQALEKIPGSDPLHTIDEREAKRILGWTEIHADPYQNQRLTPEILEEQGLSPRYQVDVDDLTLYFSRPYMNADNRLTVVGYGRTKDHRVVARTYYLSGSQALWRYLPAAIRDKWYDKGHSEDSLNLPIEAQAALGAITEENKEPLKVDNPSLIFYGTARDLGRGGITYASETERVSQLLGGGFYRTGDQPVPPEQVDFTNLQQAPNFNEKPVSWKTTSPVYGEVEMEAYPSSDGKYRYIICRNGEGKAWVGAVENTSPVGSTGVRTGWTAGGDLVMPLYEYRDQAGTYGDPQRRNGQYVEMWQNYLSKVPVIQRYLQAKAV